MKHRLVFIGTIKKVPNCGESMKNHLFINRFQKIFDRVIAVNIYQPKQHPWRIVYMVLCVILYKRSTFILSVSTSTAYKTLKLLQRLGCENLYYWVIGGVMDQIVQKRNYDKAIYANLKGIYVQSPKMVSSLERWGLKNVAYVPNSKEIDYLPTKPVPNSNKIRFVFLSRIHPEKGCDMIISNAQKLIDNGYKGMFEIDFYGALDPDYSTRFMSAVDSVEQVHYKGFLNLLSSSGYDTLATYDFMLFPTYWYGEGFPGVIIDAFISGLPVIASDWSFNSDLIDKDTGIIIPHHDSDALYFAMKNVLDGVVDILKMSKCCQERARLFDNKKVLSEENLKQLGLIQ